MFFDMSWFFAKSVHFGFWFFYRVVFVLVGWRVWVCSLTCGFPSFVAPLLFFDVSWGPDSASGSFWIGEEHSKGCPQFGRLTVWLVFLVWNSVVGNKTLPFTRAYCCRGGLTPVPNCLAAVFPAHFFDFVVEICSASGRRLFFHFLFSCRLIGFTPR